MRRHLRGPFAGVSTRGEGESESGEAVRSHRRRREIVRDRVEQKKEIGQNPDRETSEISQRYTLQRCNVFRKAGPRVPRNPKFSSAIEDGCISGVIVGVLFITFALVKICASKKRISV